VIRVLAAGALVWLVVSAAWFIAAYLLITREES
jgi:hypothetical protein